MKLTRPLGARLAAGFAVVSQLVACSSNDDASAEGDGPEGPVSPTTGTGGAATGNGGAATGTGGQGAALGGFGQGGSGNSTAAASPTLGAGASTAWDDAAFEACFVDSREAEHLPADIFVMLDKSVSMMEHRVPEPDGPTRWEVVSGGLKAFIQSPQSAGFSVGIQYFPLPPTTAAEIVSCQADVYATPDVEIGELPGNAPALVASIDGQQLGARTPSYPALAGALQHARQWALDHGGRPTAVVYATDGFPTECEPMSITRLEDLAAEYANPTDGQPRVPTFVVGVGVGTDNSLAPNLDGIAEAGGTVSARLLVDENAIDDLAGSLRRIASSPVLCKLDMPVAPGGQIIDPNQVNIRFTPEGGAAEMIWQISGAESCATQGGGWYYDNPEDPQTVHICPITCGFFGGGIVDFIFGCETMHLM